MAYTAKLNNEIFFDTEAANGSLLLSSARLDLKLGESGKFIFTVPPCNWAHGSFVKSKDYIDVYKDGDLIFSGRVYSIKGSFETQQTITCEGLLTVLNDSIFRPETCSMTLRELVARILSSHNSQVEQGKQIQLGRMTVSNVDVYRGFKNYEKSISRLQDLVETFGGFLQIRKTSGGLFLDWLAECSSGSSQAVDFGENILDITKEEDAEDLITVLVPLGASGTEGERLTIESVNDGADYIEADPEYIQKYGYIVGTKTWDDVTDPGNLKTKGEAWLDALLTPKMTINVTAIDLSDAGFDVDSFRIGQKISVTSAPHEINGEWFDCRQQSLDLLAPASNRLTLGNVKIGYVQSMRRRSTENEKTLEKIVTEYASKTFLEQAIDSATDWITGNQGGFLVELDTDNDGFIDELLFMDTPNIRTAVNVWRFNQSGWGHSSTGYNGQYTMAATLDGGIVADFITAGTLNANLVKTGILRGLSGNSYWDMATGEIYIEGYATSASVTSQITAAEGRIDTSISAVDGRVSALRQDVEGFETTVAGTYETKTDAAGKLTTAQGYTDSKVTQSATQITQAVAKTYSTKTEAKGYADDAESAANAATDSKLLNYSTTGQVNSLINQKADEITLAVGQSYATKEELQSAEEVTITGSQLHYLATASGSGVTRSTPGWTTAVQQMTQVNKYLWTYTTYTFGDASTQDTDPVITGVYGDAGAKGDKGDPGSSAGVRNVIPVYYAKENSTAPAAPSAEVTSTSTAGGIWTTAIPALTSSYPNLFTCNQIEYDDGSFSWSTVNYDSVTSGFVGLESRMATAESQIALNADAITSKVSSSDFTGANIASLINQSASTVTIQAAHIELTGQNIADRINNAGSTVKISADHIDLAGTVEVSDLSSTAQASLLTNTQAKTQFYLSTSAASAAGGSWSDTVPEWETGKYVWTRTATTRVKADGTTSTIYSPANGLYDKNLTKALSDAAQAASDATAANTTAGTAATNAASALRRSTYHYGTCSTAAGTAAKVVSLTGFELYTGAHVTVYLANANTAANPTLNVNNTGAKPVYVQNTNITEAFYWAAKDTITFVYNGTAWVMAESSANSIIADWCYSNDKTYIDGGNIYAGTITTTKLAAGAVTADKIDVADLFAQAITATDFTITGGSIQIEADSGTRSYINIYRNLSEGVGLRTQVSAQLIEKTGYLNGTVQARTTMSSTTFAAYDEIGNKRASLQSDGLWIDGNQIDYIKSQGESGDWRYRIWNSGLMELWCTKQLTGVSITGAWASGSNIYEGTLGFFSFPYTFESAPTCIAQMSGNSSGGAWLEQAGSADKTTTPRYYACRADNTKTNVTITLSIYAVGMKAA